jgi:serine protease inhibitor
MVIILPNKKTGLAALEEQLATMQLSELLQRASNTEVEVYLPKFKVETTLDLEQHLSKVLLKFPP